MSIFINNSLSRKKEEFVPLNPPQVNIYTCGVTVYDDCHIGHARSLYIFDVIRRFLSYRGFEVNFVRNITDIDDKIINRAKELQIDWKDLVKKHIDGYYADLESLGIGKADYEPRATENISEMIKYIEALIKKDYAYQVKSGVYFDVRKFKDYGKLSGQSIDQMESGTRVEPLEEKRDPLDFALWKSSKENEPFWDSPWGKGRPGWHIECSVMSQKFLKADTLDIHAGGRDLIFPHHENEIAQAEALTGKPFAKYWIHHGLLTINGQKMSKSLGNFVTISDFIKKYRSSDILKLFFLSAHYSHPIDYSENKIDEARQALERISILIGKIGKQAGRKVVGKKIKEIEEARDKFIESLDDDFNTPKGLACVFDLINITNKRIDDFDFALNAKNAIEELLGLLGFSLKTHAALAGISDEEIEAKINERSKARQDNNFALADKIRKELEENGVILEDGKDNSAWRRKL
jgi:cysteinyl-tRNA synthetase